MAAELEANKATGGQDTGKDGRDIDDDGGEVWGHEEDDPAAGVYPLTPDPVFHDLCKPPSRDQGGEDEPVTTGRGG